MKAIFKGTEASGTQNAQTSVLTPREKKIFDWKNVNFGFLNSMVIKKMFGTEDSGSQNADEQTPSVPTPKKKKIFDWENVNFGFLHYKVIKKMFSSLTEDYTIGKSGNNQFPRPCDMDRYLLLGLLHPLPDLSLH